MDASELLNTVQSKTKTDLLRDVNKAESDSSFNDVMDSISQNWSYDSNKTVEELKKQLLIAQKEVKQLRNKEGKLTKNEEKIISAIKSESLKQNTSKPQISSRIFRTTYKVSSDYFRKSIDSLIVSGTIERIETKFAGKVSSYRWKITHKSKI
jgi:predicted transcriptional regulator